MDTSSVPMPLSADAPRRDHWWRSVLHIGVIALVGGAIMFAGLLPGSRKAPSRRPAPLFDLPNIQPGQPNVSLAALRGRPVVVNFWASWCVPCRREMPALERVAERVTGVRFVGIDVKDGQGTAQAFAEKVGVTYPSGWDPQGEVAAAYGSRGLPTTAFVDENGRLVETHLGAITEKQLQAILRRRFPKVRQ